MKPNSIIICKLEIWTAHNGMGSDKSYFIGLTCPQGTLKASPSYSNKRRAESALSLARKILREFRAGPIEDISLRQIAHTLHARISRLFPMFAEGKS